MHSIEKSPGSAGIKSLQQFVHQGARGIDSGSPRGEGTDTYSPTAERMLSGEREEMLSNIRQALKAGMVPGEKKDTLKREASRVPARPLPHTSPPSKHLRKETREFIARTEPFRMSLQSLQAGNDSEAGEIFTRWGYRRDEIPRPGSIFIDPCLMSRDLERKGFSAATFPTGKRGPGSPPTAAEVLFPGNGDLILTSPGGERQAVKNMGDYMAAVAQNRRNVPGLEGDDGALREVHVALKGGGGRSKRQIAALSELYRLGVVPVSASGTSSGALLAALLACGARPEKMTELLDAPELKSWIDRGGKGGFAKGQVLYDFVDRSLRELTGIRHRPVTFSDLPCPLSIVACRFADSDTVTGGARDGRIPDRTFVFSRENTPDTPVALAVRASCSISGLYSPVAMVDPVTGRTVELVDGAAADNLPIEHNPHGLPVVALHITEKNLLNPNSFLAGKLPLPVPEGQIHAVDFARSLLMGALIHFGSTQRPQEYADAFTPPPGSFIIALPTWDIENPAAVNTMLEFSRNDSIDESMDRQTCAVVDRFLAGNLQKIGTSGEKGTNLRYPGKRKAFNKELAFGGKKMNCSYDGTVNLHFRDDQGNRKHAFITPHTMEEWLVEDLAFGDFAARLREHWRGASIPLPRFPLVNLVKSYSTPPGPLPEEREVLEKTISAIPRYDEPLPETGPMLESPGKLVKKLGGTWQMETEITAGGEKKPFAKEITIPHQWALEGADLFNSAAPVCYRKVFTADPAMMAQGRLLRLRFEGVDYRCQVFLDGTLLGTHEGYSNPFEVDVTGKLTAGKNHTLEIRVEAPADKGTPLFKNQMKGVFSQHDCRPNRIYPAYLAPPNTYGTTGGITGEVSLLSTGMETINAVHTDMVLSPDHTRARLTWSHSIDNHLHVPREATVRLRYRESSGSDPREWSTVEKKVLLQPGKNRVELHAAIDNPRLWWPWDMGTPHLYEAESVVVQEETPSDGKRFRFGIRELVFNKKDSLLTINGRKIFQRGINYTPTQYLSTYSPGKYEHDLEQMKEAHLNAVRVHGCVLPESFYDCADEKGILVWADFPLHWGQSPTPAFAEKAGRAYEEFISAYQHHPSIWNWCAQNESYPYDFYLSKVLDTIPARMDPTRPHTANASFFSHPYPGCYYLRSYRDVNLFHLPLAGEYVAQGVPASMSTFIPESKWWRMETEVRKFNNYRSGPTECYIGDPAFFSSAGDFIETTQKYQYDCLRYMTEYFRRHKYAPTTMAYPFQFKETWPATGWGMMDHAGNPKLAFHALRESMSPLLLSMEWKENRFRPGDRVTCALWTINDTGREYHDCSITWKIHPPGEPGRVLAEGAVPVALAPDSSACQREVSFSIPGDAGPGEKWVLSAQLTTNRGVVLSSNCYMFGTREKKKGGFRYEPIYPEYPPLT